MNNSVANRRREQKQLLRKRTEDILENIVRLAELLDDETLQKLAGIPLIEIAKAISVNRRNVSKEEQQGLTG